MTSYDRRSKIHVRAAVPADRAALVPLFHEMERLYDGERAIDPATVAERLDGVFDSLPGFELLVAESDGRLAGFASFATLFPGEALERMLFLKELFVSAAARRRGIGRALIAALAGIARERGATRIDWTTGAGNVSARALYDSVGAVAQREVVYYRMGPAAIARLAEEANGR